MKAKLVAGIAVPVLLASGPAKAFGLIGLLVSLAGLAVGNAGGAALSTSGVGPAGQPGATPFSPASTPATAGRAAPTSTGSIGWSSLAPPGSDATPQTKAWMKDLGWVYGSPTALDGLARPLRSRPGASRSSVQACRNAIARAAAPYGAIRVEAASGGRAAHASGATLLPVEARVVYRQPDGYAVRQARVTCRVARTGVVMLTP